MGGLFSRSSSRTPRTKQKWKKDKRKQLNDMETSTEGDKLFIQNNNNNNNTEQKNPNGNVHNSYEDWNNRIDHQQITNANDPPGAPSTYSNNYPLMQNDLMTRSWSSHHDVNNQFYQINPHQMTYDPNQYTHGPMSNAFPTQSLQVLEERPSKKVQFAHPVQQQPSFRTPLTAAQSWHESSGTATDVSTSTNARQDPVVNRQTIHRDPSLTQASVQKPIYVGIDHRATLAERGQTTANKRHHKSNEKNSSDVSDSNHRPRAHTHHHHHKNQLSEVSTSAGIGQSTKTFESLQARFSNAQRPLTTTSTSTVIANRQTQHIDQHTAFDYEGKSSKTRGIRHSVPQHAEQQQPIFDNGTKSSKTRGLHNSQAQHTEQRSSTDNDSKTSRGRKSHPQQQQQGTIHRHSSPAHTESIRRVDSRQGTPVMRIPISQQPQRQKQSSMPLTVTNTGNANRSRV